MNQHHPITESLRLQNASKERLGYHSLFSIISYLLHPAILMIATVVVYCGYAYDSLALIVRDAFVLCFIGLAPGIGWIVWNKHRKKISHYHLFFKEERRPVLLLLLGGLTLALICYTILGVPYLMLVGLAIGILGGIGIAGITWRWKISFHAAVSAGCAMLFLPILPTITWIFLGLALISGLARLPIKHHKPSEVLGGWVYGIGITVALLRLFNVW